MDGELTVGNGKKILISLNGCFFHGCVASIEGSTCHSPKKEIPDSHKKTCRACRNDDLPYDQLRPTLYHLKDGENSDSNHPLKKHLTHKEVYEQSERNLKKVTENSLGYAHVCISECELIAHYYEPVTHFLDKFHLPKKDNLDGIIFADAFRLSATNHFPLLRKTMLSQTMLIQCLRDETLQGFCIVSVRFGVVSRENLGILTPFCLVGPDGNEDKYDVDNCLVASNYLSFLLSCPHLPDFEIVDLKMVYEYRFNKTPIFGGAVSAALSFMASSHPHQATVSLLKNALNGVTGAMNFQAHRYPNAVVATHDEFNALHNYHNLLKAISIDEDHAILYLRKNAAIHNLSHVHHFVLSEGRKQLISFVLSMQHFLSVSICRTNTDGTSFVTRENLTAKELGQPLTLHLDVLLRKRSPDFLENYLAFKKRYFTHLGVCPDHESIYLKCLQENIVFRQSQCCLNHKNNDVRLIMKLEYFFDRAAILSVNRLSFSNSVTGQVVVKCSGKIDSNLKKIDKFSNSDIDALVSH